MTTGTPSQPASEHPATLRLPLLTLVALIGGLLVRLACIAIPLPDWLPPLLALLPLLVLAGTRLAKPGGTATVGDELRQGWSICTDWLAAISWWRLFFFGLFFLIAVDTLGTVLFGAFSAGDALMGLLFGLVATWVALRSDGLRPPASPALRQLASFGWKRMFLLSLLAAMIGGMLDSLVTRDAFRANPVVRIINKDAQHKDIRLAGSRIKVDDNRVSISDGDGIIKIDDQGIHVLKKEKDGSTTEKLKIGKDGIQTGESAASTPAALPPTTSEAASTAPTSDDEADAEDAAAEAEDASTVIAVKRRAAFDYGTLALVGVLALVAIKLLAGGKRRAEAEAYSARNDADLARLQREVADAKLAAMQAQIEPHFLFNTLASIEQLIRSDPARAAQVQKSLITYLRGAIPEIRDDAQRSTLGRQVEMSRAYLSIMQVRMEERLHWEIHVSEGLHGAEFPSMMLQTLIENAIKHGLEPLPQGGSLRVGAEVGRYRLIVRVEDSGPGCKEGKIPQGTGLANIRERLRLLYGAQAAFSLLPREGGGCVARIELPYRDAPPGQPE